MTPSKPIQALQIGTVFVKPGDSQIVETKTITDAQRRLAGHLIRIRSIGNGKSQIVYPG